MASYPEWKPMAAYETYKGSEPYLVVTVPAPIEADARIPLRISTWDDEITVDFDYYHSHFDRWHPEAGDTSNESARLYVEALLSEQLAVASWWQGELCKVCAQHERGAALKVPFAVSYTRVRVRSWNGALNEDRDA